MPRPVKCRRVEFFPENTYFVPFGTKGSELEQINLKVEELEAMRLKDIESLNQEQCAEKMQVSRQTFQNIIDSARKKVAMALTEGKAIKIEGGNFKTKMCELKCKSCGNQYPIQYSLDKEKCPKCSSKDVVCSEKGHFCKRWCKR